MTAAIPTPQKIAVIRTGFLGDVVFWSPLCRAFKKAFPEAKMTFVSTPKAAPIAAARPGVNRVIAFDKKKTHAGLSQIPKIAAEQEAPELVLVPHRPFRSALLAYFSRPEGHSQTRVGRSSLFWRPLFTHPVVI
ncbi:MAG: hypothetical protein LBM75_09815 [Myxococcales bacterium]|jgi:ADP-heptose:LPS heptosyltransferase|nr:hypothetical protein [Myxococcales bacterium]